MSLEIQRDGVGRYIGCCTRFLAAATAVSSCATNRPNYRRCEMNVLPEMLPTLADLKKRFADRLDAVHSPRANEIYLHAKIDLVAGFTAYLYHRWKARLVSLFADDARENNGAFHLYYVFTLDAVGGFIILRVPVLPDEPEFASLTNAIPAVNWQEREVQDL